MKPFLALSLLFVTLPLNWLGGARFASYWATVKGNRSYAKKNYTEALKHYRAAQREDPTGSVPPYNLGVALYQQRKYAKAIKSFEQSLNSDDSSLQARAYYNIGNCYFRSNDLVKAIESYKKSLQLDPKDSDAKFNLELARRKLKEMAQKQQKKQQPQRQPQAQQARAAASQAQQEQNKQQQSCQKKEEKEGTKRKENKQPGRRKGAMSQEDARRLLQAVAQQEKEARRKAQRRLQMPGEYQVEKDW